MGEINQHDPKDCEFEGFGHCPGCCTDYYIESGNRKSSRVDARKFGPHHYPDAPDGTSDCKYGCGCWAGPHNSGGPVDPFGACPKNPLQPYDWVCPSCKEGFYHDDLRRRGRAIAPVCLKCGRGVLERRRRTPKEIGDALDQTARLAKMSTREKCREFSIQDCHKCENAECGDNTTPAIVDMKQQLARTASGHLQRLRDANFDLASKLGAEGWGDNTLEEAPYKALARIHTLETDLDAARQRLQAVSDELEREKQDTRRLTWLARNAEFVLGSCEGDTGLDDCTESSWILRTTTHFKAPAAFKPANLRRAIDAAIKAEEEG